MAKLEVAHKNLKLIIDPLNQWPNEDPERTLLATGYIPQFVSLAYMSMGEDTAQTVVDMYGMGSWAEDTNGSWEEDGTRLYPGDPPQYPIMKLMPIEELDIETSLLIATYVYDHGFVMFREKGRDLPRHLRMD